MRYRLRPATERDGSFIYRLRVATLKDYVEQIWGWDEAYQSARFFKRFAPSEWQVIVVQGRDVGALQVWQEGAEVILGNIQIAPEYQSRGLGSVVIRDILAEAKRDGLPVTLWVLRGNPAKRLYERLGFAVVEETATQHKLRALFGEDWKASQQVEGIPNFLRISEAIGSGGQPTREQFADIRAAGYEMVVNLAMPESPNALPDEGQVVAGQGMEYVHIPVVWDSPTTSDLEHFFTTMDGCRDRKVFVHCVVNKRVSSFVFLYRVLRQGVPPGVAREALSAVWEPNAVWRDFINDCLTRRGIGD